MLLWYMITFGSETEIPISNDSSNIIDIFNRIIETLQNTIYFNCFLLAIILIFLSIFFIRSKANKYTERQLSSLKKNGKYIPGVFVELNDSKEVLRYFLYGKKWKHRLICKFNHIYNNSYGDILKKGSLEKKLQFELSIFASMDKVI